MYQSNRVLVIRREHEGIRDENITKIDIRGKGGVRNVK